MKKLTLTHCAAAGFVTAHRTALSLVVPTVNLAGIITKKTYAATFQR